LVKSRTALCNQLRGLLRERGVVVRVGVAGLKRSLPAALADESSELSGEMREFLGEMGQWLRTLEQRIASCEMSWRAQYCAPPLASIPTTQRGSPRNEAVYLRTPRLPAHHHSLAATRSAHREHILCQVEPDRCNFLLGPSSLCSDIAQRTQGSLRDRCISERGSISSVVNFHSRLLIHSSCGNWLTHPVYSRIPARRGNL
jgi:hypothetical protein